MNFLEWILDEFTTVELLVLFTFITLLSFSGLFIFLMNTINYESALLNVLKAWSVYGNP